MVLGKYRVIFLLCRGCGSLQTEEPYWLDEAYSTALAATDTGVVTRNLICQAAVKSVALVLRIRGPFLDFGGGPGLLCRLLRDRGHDAYLFDKYAEPIFVPCFHRRLDEFAPGQLGMLTAVEVFEHCVKPAEEIRELFAAQPQTLLATTIPYRGEGREWWYLGAQTGQHIFFYSKKALQFLAKQNQYHYFGIGAFHLFSRTPLAFWQKASLKFLLSRLGLRIERVLLAATLRSRYSDLDCDRIGEQLRGDARSRTVQARPSCTTERRVAADFRDNL